jgi:antibiotic biosynthesis monooxygenase (ABM) superfamily enzyme
VDHSQRVPDVSPATDQELGLEIIAAESRYSAIISQRIDPSLRDQYLDWQRGITTAASKYPGYSKTEVFEPVPNENPEWVTLIHFKDNQSLEHWIASPERKRWTEQFHQVFGTYEFQKLGGLDAWFSSVKGSAPIPDWRIAATVVLALYPTVMLWTLYVAPHLASLPFAASMLIGNIASVSLLQWLLMPPVTRALSFWLQPTRNVGLTATVAGFAAIAGLLAAMVWLFERIGQAPPIR